MGETRCITLNIYNDTRVENEEYFTLIITNRYNTRIEGSSSARINILDNDGIIFIIIIIINTIYQEECALLINFYNDNNNNIIIITIVTALYTTLNIDISSWICCCFVHG